jgi:hypothetical protein
MSENEKPKKQRATEVIAKMPRRNTYDSAEHGTGNPHLQPGELCESKIWNAHKSQGTAKPPKKSA